MLVRRKQVPNGAFFIAFFPLKRFEGGNERNARYGGPEE
jgi:hypothetical protein